MHEIQKHILKLLTSSKSAKFSGLKPKSVESNQFVYHLKNLVREDLIRNTDRKYCLSPKGKLFASRVTFETFKERIQPKIVTIIVLKNKLGDYLFYKRRISPFMGKIGFPYGKIHLEEKLIEAAGRELLEKTGLQAKLKHAGDVYLTIHNETELAAHMLCHVFSGSNPLGILRTDNIMGSCFWLKPEEISTKDLMPGVIQILKLLKKSKNFFFDEYFLNVSDKE